MRGLRPSAARGKRCMQQRGMHRTMCHTPSRPGFRLIVVPVDQPRRYCSTISCLRYPYNALAKSNPIHEPGAFNAISKTRRATMNHSTGNQLRIWLA